MFMPYPEADREPIPFRTAFLGVVASTLLRAPWFVLLLIMPRTATGMTLFCLVLVSAGVVLLHWCLDRLGWTISFRAALASRAFPAVVAASATGAFGLRASLPVLLGMAGLELLLTIGVVATKATRSRMDGVAGFEEGELLPIDPDDVVPAEERYSRDVASLVREARDARLRPSTRSSY